MSGHVRQVVAVPEQVEQFVLQDKQLVPLTKYPAPQAMQVVPVIGLKNVPPGQAVQVVAAPEQVRQFELQG